MYSAGGKTQCTHSSNVLHDRWKKLVYNACLNPICAITGLDSGRIRLADGAVDGLVRPAMREIIAAAKAAADVELADGIVQWTIEMDPLESYLKPSMQQDLDKVRDISVSHVMSWQDVRMCCVNGTQGNFIEFENLLGEPLREGKKAGVPMPTLGVLYQLAKAIQWRNQEKKGLVEVPKKK